MLDRRVDERVPVVTHRRVNRQHSRSVRLQPPPVEPCTRFSRTRLSDALHRRCSTGARQVRLGLGAMTVPLRSINPSRLGELL